jgi:serine/threonine protein phosphatase PrpC
MNIVYGIAADIGFRQSMEDAHAIWDLPEENLFSAEVYDGHAGREAAYAASELLTPHFLSLLRSERREAAHDRRPDRELLRETYLAADRYIISRGIDSGTAVATFHILGDTFLAGNAGDSRVIIGTSRHAAQLTVDHKPNLPAERSRIESLGGQVVTYTIPRVQGVLAMSRALGDPGLKPYVSSEPRIVEGLLGSENDFAVVACDGVWDVLTPDDVMKTVRDADGPQPAAERVVAKALASGSSDNVTVIVLDLRQRTAQLSRHKMEILKVLDRANE